MMHSSSAVFNSHSTIPTPLHRPTTTSELATKLFIATFLSSGMRSSSTYASFQSFSPIDRFSDHRDILWRGKVNAKISERVSIIDIRLEHTVKDSQDQAARIIGDSHRPDDRQKCEE